MTSKRHKLRLRKQVLLTLPILLLLLIASLGFMINKNKIFANEVSSNNQSSPNTKEETNWNLSDIPYIQKLDEMITLAIKQYKQKQLQGE